MATIWFYGHVLLHGTVTLSDKCVLCVLLDVTCISKPHLFLFRALIVEVRESNLASVFRLIKVPVYKSKQPFQDVNTDCICLSSPKNDVCTCITLGSDLIISPVWLRLVGLWHSFKFQKYHKVSFKYGCFKH